MWLKSLYQVTIFNSIINFYEFKRIQATRVDYFDHPKDDNQIIIKYWFDLNLVTYENEIVANKEAFDIKVGINEIQIIYYNTIFPRANYIENWELDQYYILMFIMFSIFLSLIIFFHLKVNKDYWIRKYTRAFNG